VGTNTQSHSSAIRPHVADVKRTDLVKCFLLTLALSGKFTPGTVLCTRDVNFLNRDVWKLIAWWTDHLGCTLVQGVWEQRHFRVVEMWVTADLSWITIMMVHQDTMQMQGGNTLYYHYTWYEHCIPLRMHYNIQVNDCRRVTVVKVKYDILGTSYSIDCLH
jgi:hypothetical protein